MHSQLAIIHSTRTGSSASVTSDKYVVWQTCVRELKIGQNDDLNSDIFNAGSHQEVYQGRDAYRFLLEIVCGLQSPVKGETEVHGQFRELLDQVDKNHKMYSILQKVNLDARKVRATHLQGLGSQSYGSLARKKLRGYNSVAILGAGQLAREIVPWLAKQNMPIEMFLRKPEKHQDLATKHNLLKIYSLTDDVKIKSKALILAAPMPSGVVSDWLATRGADLDLILDYRGESHFDPLSLNINYYSLRDIFREIDNTQQKIEAEIQRAKQLVATICESY